MKMEKSKTTIVKTTTWSAGPGCHGGCGVLAHIKDNKLVNAAGLFFDRLFFGRNPACRLEVATYKGTDTATRLDQQSFKGNLLEAIETAQRTITRQTSQRSDQPRVDTEAIREAVINAFCHRDYRDPSPVQITIYQDRIEIRNPGTLMLGMELADLAKGRVSRPRNPLIADLLQRIKLVTSTGQGIPLILEKAPDTTLEIQSNSFIARLPLRQ